MLGSSPDNVACAEVPAPAPKKPRSPIVKGSCNMQLGRFGRQPADAGLDRQCSHLDVISYGDALKCLGHQRNPADGSSWNGRSPLETEMGGRSRNIYRPLSKIYLTTAVSLCLGVK
ncbi:hypothetical protein HZ326_15234 [Fusarium oxysporum f. sp. albedinis]|nr:hypothetical protein HZ326_15234 [Fusarium oxysporum f. sp. albedinis]